MTTPTPSGRASAATITARGPARAAWLSPATPAAPIERYQEALPPALRSVPLQALLAGGGVALVCVVVLFSALVRSNKVIEALEEDVTPAEPAASPTARPGATAAQAVPVSPIALPTEIDSARLGGADSLAILAQRYPEDARVLEALAVAQVRDKKDYGGALRALRQLLQVAPQTSADADVRQALIEIANGPADVAAEAFELMKTKLGPAGPDVLYELVQASSGKYAKEHAAGALAEVMKSASKALVVADELRRSLPCARKAFVSRAAADGDGRSLPHLRQMVANNCRGLLHGAECFQCFTPQERAAISSAIETIEKREKR